MSVHQDAKQIIDAALRAALPDTAVKKALEKLPPCRGRLILVAVGKAAWQMASAAYEELRDWIDGGTVITKYHHSMGSIGNLTIYEAGHPVPDENSCAATDAAINMVENLGEEDTVLFLVSGGGSALFEKPLIPLHELADITAELLSSGADIVEINTIRKRLSAVKGGKFAALCAPAQVFAVLLSDIVGDPLDMIASGPAYPDSATTEDALRIAEKYGLRLSDEARALLRVETPKRLDNVQTHVTGSVRQLCAAAEVTAESLGYQVTVLTSELCCEAREAGSFLASIARHHAETEKSLAFIAGGETVVHLTGNGLGGRNQELALSAAKGISGLCDTLLFSVGSDGTDGPTDAAGGLVDGETLSRLTEAGCDIEAMLRNNDAYHALQAADGLIFTGPTGTNVNDLSVLLIRREK